MPEMRKNDGKDSSGSLVRIGADVWSCAQILGARFGGVGPQL